MNRIDLDGRSAIVTGGARGIGFAAAQRFVASGARVAIWDLLADRAAEAVASLGGAEHAVAVAVDIADPASIDSALTKTLDALGGVDILVNSAAIAGDNARVWETPVDEWRRVIDIDLNGTFFVCRAVTPHMIERGYGRIVSLASIAGKEGNPTAAHYSSAKAGVIALTKSLGKELVGTGVLCNCIAPAMIDTEMIGQVTEQHKQFMISKIPMGRVGTVEEVAALIAWLSSEDCSFSTGAVFDISGGRATY